MILIDDASDGVIFGDCWKPKVRKLYEIKAGINRKLNIISYEG